MSSAVSSAAAVKLSNAKPNCPRSGGARQEQSGHARSPRTRKASDPTVFNLKATLSLATGLSCAEVRAENQDHRRVTPSSPRQSQLKSKPPRKRLSGERRPPLCRGRPVLQRIDGETGPLFRDGISGKMKPRPGHPWFISIPESIGGTAVDLLPDPGLAAGHCQLR